MHKRRGSDEDPLLGVVNQAVRRAMYETPPIPQKVGGLIIVAWLAFALLALLAGLSVSVMTFDWGLPYREFVRGNVRYLVLAAIPVVLFVVYAHWRQR